MLERNSSVQSGPELVCESSSLRRPVKRQQGHPQGYRI